MPRSTRWALLLGGASSGAAVILSATEQRRNEELSYRQELINEKDLHYYANITVAEQVLKAIMDTGSLEFTVISDKCGDSCGDMKAQRKMFHARKSATYKKGKEELNLEYASGMMTGQLAYDKVAIGPFTAENVGFWETFAANMDLVRHYNIQAIVGLAPISEGVAFIVDGKDAKGCNAVLPHDLGINRYGVCLGRERGSSGYVTWNDNAHLENSALFSKLPVKDKGYWMTSLTDVEIGSFKACEKGCGGLIDSGMSLLGVPDESHDALAKEVIKAGCDLERSPPLRFKLEGIQYSLPPEAYLGNFVGQPSAALAGHFELEKQEERRGICQAALMHFSMPSSLTITRGPVWVLGMPFLREYYTVFAQATSTEGPTIYTAPAAKDCTPQGPALSLYLQREEITVGTHANIKPRTYDASKIRAPLWLHRAAATNNSIAELWKPL